MTFVAFFQWWYGAGWAQEFRRITGSPLGLLKGFDVGTLLATLFKPWKRISTGSYRDQSLGNKFGALVDNLVSRFVGFWMRLMVLIVVLAGSLLLFIVHALGSLAWPLLPAAPFILAGWGLLG